MGGKLVLPSGLAPAAVEYIHSDSRFSDAYQHGSKRIKRNIMGLAKAVSNPASIQLRYMQVRDFKTGRITAFEALTYMGRSPKLTDDHWVKTAERLGTIAKLDISMFVRVLEGYSRQRAFLKENLQDPEELQVAVNIHPFTWGLRDCAEILRDCVQERKLDVTKVILEITEHQPLSECAVRQVRRASGFGFPILYDDFGKGEATVAAAQEIPLTGIKLDLRTTKTHCRAGLDRIEIERLIGKVKKLNVGVIVAEGVQCKNQLGTLHELGATHAQGFYFSQPCRLDTSFKQLRHQFDAGESPSN